jgi:hypothetical protein
MSQNNDMAFFLQKKGGEGEKLLIFSLSKLKTNKNEFKNV